jgi:hypothetical protein
MKYPDEITRLRAPIAGNRAPGRDWSLAVEKRYTELQVQPASSAPMAETNREGVLSTFNLYGRPFTDVDVVPTDRVRLADGSVCRVLGRVRRFKSPATGRFHHYELTVEEVRG